MEEFKPKRKYVYVNIQKPTNRATDQPTDRIGQGGRISSATWTTICERNLLCKSTEFPVTRRKKNVYVLKKR